jgi:hypothetical protein
MSNTISWGEIYKSSWFGDEANKASIPCYSAPEGFCDSGYNTFLQATIDAATAAAVPLPNDAALAKLNTLLNSIASVTPKLDGFGVMFNHNAEAFGRYNLLNPAIIASPVSSPTWTNALGYQGNGTNAHVDLGFAPPAATNYSLNSATAGVWVTATAAALATSAIMGALTSNNLQLRSFSGAPQRINASGNTSPAIGQNVVGAHSFVRSANTTTNLYVNGDAAQASSVAATAVPLVNFSLLRAAGTIYGTGAVGAWWIGEAITEADHDTITTALTIYAA